MRPRGLQQLKVPYSSVLNICLLLGKCKLGDGFAPKLHPMFSEYAQDLLIIINFRTNICIYLFFFERDWGGGDYHKQAQFSPQQRYQTFCPKLLIRPRSSCPSIPDYALNCKFSSNWGSKKNTKGTKERAQTYRGELYDAMEC